MSGRAEMLCVYHQVKILKQAACGRVEEEKAERPVAIISYDEKRVSRRSTTAPDLPPEPGAHATFAREHEYKRHGTVSLLAGIDLVTGKVHALVKDRHAAGNSSNSYSFLIPPDQPVHRNRFSAPTLMLARGMSQASR